MAWFLQGRNNLFCNINSGFINCLPTIVFRAIAFFTYGNSKKFYTELNNGHESPFVHLISAASAGVVTATATNPIWVVKTRLQLQAVGQKLYKNSFDCALQIIKEEGIKGLYKGMSASYLGRFDLDCWTRLKSKIVIIDMLVVNCRCCGGNDPMGHL